VKPLTRLLAALLPASLLVAPQIAPAAVHGNGGVITIPTVGDASPFPSTIDVSGEAGLITDLNVRFTNFDHTLPTDLDVSLLSPAGESVALISDACGVDDASDPADDAVDVNWTFDQDAPAAFPQGDPCPSGTYRPVNYGAGDGWVGDVPQESLGEFNGENPNGTWRLYVRDDSSNDGGQIEMGWSLEITTGSATIAIPGTGDSGPANPYPLTRIVGGLGGVITDVNVAINGFTHSNPDDVDMFLEGPQGQRAWLISDACGTGDISDRPWLFDDTAPVRVSSAGGSECGPGAVRGADYDDGLAGGDDIFAGPAFPPPPGAAALTAFNLTDPNGEWKLYARDDQAGNAGFIVGGYDLQIATRPGAEVGFAAPQLTTTEGQTVELRLVRSGASALGRGSVELTTTGGTALENQDFPAVRQTVEFAPGATEATVPVAIPRNRGGERAESFRALIRNPDDDAAIGVVSSTTVVIRADAAFNSRNSVVAPTTARCRRRGESLRFRPRTRPGLELVDTRVFVNGRRVLRRTGAKADDVFRVRMRGRRMRVRIRFRAADGRVVNVRRTYRRCARRR
jgi:subtilisin-like proprotein convertase family protein